jgi:hypothetical protein
LADVHEEEPTMTNLTTPSEHMALLDMQLDEVQPTRVSGSIAADERHITDFVRPHKNGRLQVEANAIHQGRTQQLWQVEIRRPDDSKLVARGQVRLQNIDG